VATKQVRSKSREEQKEEKMAEQRRIYILLSSSLESEMLHKVDLKTRYDKKNNTDEKERTERENILNSSSSSLAGTKTCSSRSILDNTLR
jgi:hypothetical protein